MLNTEKTLNLYALGCLGKPQMISWAEIAVSEGLESHALYLLAGETENSYLTDVIVLFEQALNELGLTIPTKEKSLENYFIYLLSEIVENRLSPPVGAQCIEEVIYGHPGYDKDCIGLVTILWEYGELYDPDKHNEGRQITRKEREEFSDRLIISEAKRILEERKFRY